MLLRVLVLSVPLGRGAWFVCCEAAPFVGGGRLGRVWCNTLSVRAPHYSSRAHLHTHAAQMMEKLEQTSCCCCPRETSCCSHCCCLFSFAMFVDGTLQHLVGMVPFVGWIASPFVRLFPLISKNSREAIHAKYGVPADECWGSCCAHYWCFQCALLQVGRGK